MTLHDWIKNWPLDEKRPIPKGENAQEIAYYARSRFGYDIRRAGIMLLVRVCPHCAIERGYIGNPSICPAGAIPRNS